MGVPGDAGVCSGRRYGLIEGRREPPADSAAIQRSRLRTESGSGTAPAGRAALRGEQAEAQKRECFRTDDV